MVENSVQLENVERAILTLRGERVIMDSDLVHGRLNGFLNVLRDMGSPGERHR